MSNNFCRLPNREEIFCRSLLNFCNFLSEFRNDIESKSPIVGPPRGSTLQRSATLPANPKLAKRPVPWRVRSPSTDQVCVTEKKI